MRRRRAERREPRPDPKYNSRILGKFINMVMERGKKSIAEHIVYSALEELKQKVPDKDSLQVFEEVIENVRPLVEVKSRRIGGATYQVPVEVKPERGRFMAMRWIRDFAKAQKGKPMKDRLAAEMLNAYKKEGPSMKKREDTHRMAEANKAFAHYRW